MSLTEAARKLVLKRGESMGENVTDDITLPTKTVSTCSRTRNKFHRNLNNERCRERRRRHIHAKVNLPFRAENEMQKHQQHQQQQKKVFGRKC